MKKTLILASLLMMNGCATYSYVQTGKSETDMQRDFAQCEYEASIATAGIRNRTASVMKYSDLRIQCMESRGYDMVKDAK